MTVIVYGLKPVTAAIEASPVVRAWFLDAQMVLDLGPDGKAECWKTRRVLSVGKCLEKRRAAVTPVGQWDACASRKSGPSAGSGGKRRSPRKLDKGVNQSMLARQ